MTTDEKAAYKFKREMGACHACKKRKTRCTHFAPDQTPVLGYIADPVLSVYCLTTKTDPIKGIPSAPWMPSAPVPTSAYRLVNPYYVEPSKLELTRPPREKSSEKETDARTIDRVAGNQPHPHDTSTDIISPHIPQFWQGGRYAYFDKEIDKEEDERAANQFE
jgi:hypothetical protein